MKFLHLILVVLAAAPSMAVQRSARELFNEGTGRLGKGELREAEAAFREAAAGNEETVLPLALYNLGHVRYQQGVETLKGEGKRQQLIDSAGAAVAVAEEAIRQGGKALESEELREIIGAYMEARAARKELRVSRDDTRRTLDLIGAALTRWRRSAGDFHGAVELDPANEDATYNAGVVERKIEELLKFKKELEQQGESVAEQREKIKEVMKKMRGKIPKEMQRGSDDEEDDEDEEEEEGRKEPKVGEKQQQRIGGEREVSPEMARWLKETMKRRTMSLEPGEGEGFRANDEPRKPQQRKGRDW